MADWFSIYWAAPIAAWLVAQLVKILIAIIKKDRSEPIPTLVSSGSMPSSHSAITMALLVVIGAKQGIGTAEFGIAFVVTCVVIYDALNVRRAVGEQGQVLKTLAKSVPFYTAKGHPPTEVIAGAALGIAVAFGLLQIL